MAKNRAAKTKKSPAKRKKSTPKVPKKPRVSGKFQKGNTAGSLTKGKHPEAKRKRNLAEAFKAAVTITDIKAIAKKLVKEAKAGNAKAAKEVLDRCCGKPPQDINLGDADGNPLIPTQILLLHGEVQE